MHGSRWSAQLAGLEDRALLRKLRMLDSPQSPIVSTGGRSLLNFSSNDYLGFANHPALKEAATEAVARYGVGAGASRLVCGTLAAHAQLEERIAAFKGTEAALAFSTGYAAALGAIPALVGKGDVVILDKLAHACLIDAAKLSGATLRIFPHNQMERLAHLLRWASQKHPDAQVLVVTESVFSMDGDCAPLREIVELKERFGAMLFLDEAHALGVLGRNGRGLADSLHLGDRVDIQMGTLGKALGVSGGTICGTRSLVDLLINRARSFVYSTAPSPVIAATCTAAIDLLDSPTGEQAQSRLWENIRQFAGETSAILPRLIGNETRALEMAANLLEAGFLIPAIRYPTVAAGTARLRIALSAAHLPEQIERLRCALEVAGC